MGRFLDHVQENTSTTGTSDFVLSGASEAMFDPLGANQNGQEIYYTCEDRAGGKRETGIGTYTHATRTLARTAVLSGSSGAGNKVSFGAGPKRVFATAPADALVDRRGANTFTAANTFEQQVTISVADGTAPLAITSTTVCTNLNSDLLDGQHGGYYRDVGNANAGTLAVARGGTGLASYAVGDLLYADGAASLAKLAGVATGNVLISGGVTTAPSWGKVTLGTHTAGNYVASIAGTANQVTASGSTGDVALSLPQNIHTSATPQFAGLTLSASPPSLTLTYPAISGVVIKNQGAVGQLLYDGTSCIEWTTGGAVYLKGPTQVTGNLTVYTGGVSTQGQFTSLLETGTAPISVTSTTVCTNLNADTCDGQHLGTSNSPTFAGLTVATLTVGANPSNVAEHFFGAQSTFTRTSSSGATAALEAIADPSASSSALIIGFDNKCTVKSGNSQNLTTSVGVIGNRTKLTHAGSGTLTGAANFYAQTPTASAGSFTHCYGIYIASQKSGVVGSGWGVYQVGTSDNNYFAGNVLIGTASVGTNAARVIAVANGTAPSTFPVVQLWAQSGELKVADTGGVITQLSEHSRAAPDWLYDGDEFPERMARVEHNGYIQFVNVTRMAKLVQAIAKIPNIRQNLDRNEVQTNIIHQETMEEYNARMAAMQSPQ